MITYEIQHTHAGDYIVRGPGTREMARVATENEARAWIVRQNIAEMDAASAATHEREEQRAFDATVPDLNATQIEWQEWRNRLYDQLLHEGRRLTQWRAHLDNVPEGDGPGTSGSPSYASHEAALTDDQRRYEDARALYERAVHLDTAIKAARREHDADRLADLLSEAQAMLPEMALAAGTYYVPSQHNAPDASRHLTIQVRVNDYERARIGELAAAKNITTAEYVRQRALGD